MSAENELFIYLRMEAAQAEATSRAYHQAEEQRVHQTAEVYENSEKQYIKAIKLRERAGKELIASQLKGEKDFADKQKQLLNEVAQLQKKLGKQEIDDRALVDKAITDSKKKAAAERASIRKSELDLLKLQLRQELQASNEAAAQAEATSRAYHQAEQQRVHQAAEVYENSEKQYIKAIKLRERAGKELIASQLKGEKDFADKQKQLLNEVAQLQKKLGKQEIDDQALVDKAITDSKKKAAAERASIRKSELDLLKLQLRQELQASNEAADQEESRRQKKLKGELDLLKLQLQQGLELSESARKTESSIMGVAKAYTMMRIAAVASQAANAAMDAVGQAAKEANDHIKQMVDNMEKIRDTVQELASLRNKDNGAKFSAEVSREAAAAGSTTQMHVAAQKTFMQYAASRVGTQGADAALEATEANAGKSSYKDSQELSLFAETNANAQGIDPSEGTKLMATVIRQRKPGQTKDDLKLLWRQMMETMKLAAGPTGPMLGKLNEEVMESVGDTGSFKEAKDAAVFMRVMADANPTKAYTYTEAVTRGNREIRANKKNQMEELGITRGMTEEQMVMQAMKRSEEIAKEEGGGVTSEDVLSRYYKDARQFRGIEIAINQGIKNKGFENARADFDKIKLEDAEKENKGYLGGELGTKRRQEAQSDTIDAVKSDKFIGLREQQRDYANRLKNSGRLDDPENILDQLANKKKQVLYGKTNEEIKRDEMMGEAITGELRKSKEGTKFLKEQGAGQKGSNLGPQTSDKVMAEAINMSKQKGLSMLPAKPPKYDRDAMAKGIRDAADEVAWLKKHPGGNMVDFRKWQRGHAENDPSNTGGIFEMGMLERQMPKDKPRATWFPGIKRPETIDEFKERQSQDLATHPKEAAEVIRKLGEAADKLIKAGQAQQLANNPQVKPPIARAPVVVGR